MSIAKITAADIRGMKNRRRIAALTAYDYPMTKPARRRRHPA